MLQKIKDILHNRSLKIELIILFLAVSILPLITLSALYYKIYSNDIVKNKISETVYELGVIDRDFKDLIYELDLITIRTSLDTNVQNLLDKELNLERNQLIKEEFELNKKLFDQKYSNGKNIPIFVVDLQGNVYTNSTEIKINYQSPKLFEWLERSRGKESIIFPMDKTLNTNIRNYIPLIRSVYKRGTDKTIGLVMIYINEKYIFDIYKDALKNPGNDIYILNEDGIVLSQRNKNNINKNFVDIMVDHVNFKGLNGHYNIKIDGKEYVLNYFVNRNHGWKYISMIPIEIILKSTQKIRTITILAVSLLVIVCFLFSIFLSIKVTNPLKKICIAMDKSESGDLEKITFTRNNDEIGKLILCFNKMTDRLKKTISDIYDVQQKKRKAELKVLEFQINPHFLYNAFSSIIWLAHEGENEKVIEMTDSISKLFRISLSKGKEIIKIGEEIEYSERYLNIQKIRYNHEFKSIFDIDKKILSYYTPKLILQPLIENSVYHGIRNLKKGGVVKIVGKKEDSQIVFKIMDNGGNMSEQKAAYINDSLNNEKWEEDDGIGIKNVSDRIKLFFTNKYGLSFMVENSFTIAKVVIPIINEKNKKCMIS